MVRLRMPVTEKLAAEGIAEGPFPPLHITVLGHEGKDGQQAPNEGMCRAWLQNGYNGIKQIHAPSKTVMTIKLFLKH